MPETKVSIAGVRIDDLTLDEAGKKVLSWAKSTQKGYITTPNPEILLKARREPAYKKILNKSLLNLPDGIGVLWAAEYLAKTKGKGQIAKIIWWVYTLLRLPFRPKGASTVLRERVTGTDLLQLICQKAAHEKVRIFFLGAAQGVAEALEKKLCTELPALQICGTHAGAPAKRYDQHIIRLINTAKPHILFVAYGAPAQEYWIARNLPHLHTVRIAIGVGGAFDFHTGHQKRAPFFLQNHGLEWLYRLLHHPSRLRRIINATIRFPLVVLKENL